MAEPAAASPSVGQSSRSSPKHARGGGRCGERVPAQRDWAGAEHLSPGHPALPRQVLFQARHPAAKGTHARPCAWADITMAS